MGYFMKKIPVIDITDMYHPHQDAGDNFDILSAFAVGPLQPLKSQTDTAEDTHAFVRVLRSGLPLAIYPCATVNGPFDIGPFNTFWSLKNSSFIRKMSLPLRRYLTYVFNNLSELNFLRYLEIEPSAKILTELPSSHNVWETAVWMQVAGRRLVATDEGFRYLPIETATSVLQEELLPCTINRSFIL